MRLTLAAGGAWLVAVLVVATTVALIRDRPWVDMLFVGLLLSFVLVVAEVVGGSVVRSRAAARREQEVVSVGPQEATRRAVEDERMRLSVEIDRSVRRSLLSVRSLVAQAGEAADPRPALLAVQAETRSAMSELRRQLGLMTDGPERTEVVGDGDAVGAGTKDPQSLGVPDLLVTAAVLMLTSVEMLVVPGQTGSWPMSAVATLTLLARRVAPARAAFACAAVILVGAVGDAHVGDGLFYPIVVGLLLWSVLHQRPTAGSMTAAVVLVACAVGSRWAYDPGNGAINVVLLSVVAVAAVVVGRTRRSRAGSDERSSAHEKQLAPVREAATATTRRAVASELHDVVSHAVSLVAVQAGAAELAWPDRAEETRAGLRAIEETVGTALTELDVSAWGRGPTLTWGDVEVTIDRLRRAGLDVRLTVVGQAPRGLLSVVHRLVQEALTNVLRHAGPATAHVEIRSAGGRTHVEVRDDGPGCASRSGGYGLVGLEDRVANSGGTLSVGSGPRGGFVLRAELPHPPATEAQEGER